MTLSGYSRLEAELKRLKTVERPDVIDALEEARAHGDLSENAEYETAKERQAMIERRVADIESKLARAQVIDTANLEGTTVKFGAQVTVVDDDNDEASSFQIVGEDEADIRSNRLSIKSPLARSLIGKSVGDEIQVMTPGGGKHYELTKIEYE